MWIADKYIDYVREQTIENPGQSWGKMLMGFQANKLRTKLLPKKDQKRGRVCGLFSSETVCFDRS